MGEDAAADSDAVEAALAELGIWSADRRVRAEASARSRERWILQQQIEDASMTSLLVDLAEQQEGVAIQTGSAVHSGSLIAVGANLAVIEDRRGATTLVRIAAIVSVESSPAKVPDPRSPTLTLTFDEALRALAADLVPVRLYLRTGAVTGWLAGAGEDVLVVHRDVEGAQVRARRQLTVNFEAVEACALR